MWRQGVARVSDGSDTSWFALFTSFQKTSSVCSRFSPRKTHTNIIAFIQGQPLWQIYSLLFLSSIELSQEFVLSCGFISRSIFWFRDCSRTYTWSHSSSLQSLRVTSRKQGGIRRRSLLKSRFQSIFVPVQFSQSRDRRSSSPIVYFCFAENLSVRALRLELIIISRRTEQSVSAFSNVPISKAFNWDSSPFA